MVRSTLGRSAMQFWPSPRSTAKSARASRTSRSLGSGKAYRRWAFL
jgi:hypothetical protein